MTESEYPRRRKTREGDEEGKDHDQEDRSAVRAHLELRPRPSARPGSLSLNFAGLRVSTYRSSRSPVRRGPHALRLTEGRAISSDNVPLGRSALLYREREFAPPIRPSEAPRVAVDPARSQLSHDTAAALTKATRNSVPMANEQAG